MKKIIFVITLFGGLHTAFAQETDSITLEYMAPLPIMEDTTTASVNPGIKSNYNISPRNAIRFGDAVVYSWTGPLRWKKNEWIKAGIVVGATGLLFLIDKPANDFWKKQDSKFMHSVERAGFHYGKPYAAMISMGGFLLVGTVLNNEWAKETAWILGSSYASSGALQSLMKEGFGRRRPGEVAGPMEFEFFDKRADYHSFPSGHIQIAMTTAVVLAERVNSPWLKGLFYATAATTMASRMYSNSHWVSDLFFGSAISYFVAKSNIKRWKQTETQKPFTDMLDAKPKITWNLQYFGNGVGLVARF